jgi:hypothetical protein
MIEEEFIEGHLQDEPEFKLTSLHLTVNLYVR